MNIATLDPPRWPGGPAICQVANLPAFATEKEAAAFNNRNGHLPILAQWPCKFCGHIHYWATSPTDSNGNHKAGADVLPNRIVRLELGLSPCMP